MIFEKLKIFMFCNHKYVDQKNDLSYPDFDDQFRD